MESSPINCMCKKSDLITLFRLGLLPIRGHLHSKAGRAICRDVFSRRTQRLSDAAPVLVPLRPLREIVVLLASTSSFDRISLAAWDFYLWRFFDGFLQPLL